METRAAAGFARRVRGGGRRVNIDAMRRLPRHAFTFGAAASLLLCVAAVALWVKGRVAPRAYIRQTWDERTLTSRTDVLECYGGGLVFGRTQFELDVPPAPGD